MKKIINKIKELYNKYILEDIISENGCCAFCEIELDDDEEYVCDICREDD